MTVYPKVCQERLKSDHDSPFGYPKLQLGSVEALLEGTSPGLPDMADPYMADPYTGKTRTTGGAVRIIDHTLNQRGDIQSE